EDGWIAIGTTANSWIVSYLIALRQSCPSSAGNRGLGPAILGQIQRDIQNNPAPPQSYPVYRVVSTRLSPFSIQRQASVGVASDKSGPRAVSHRQRSQRHLDYAL